MAETIKTTPVANSRRIVEECVEFAKTVGVGTFQARANNRRATSRKVFAQCRPVQINYCTNSILSEN